MIPKYRYVKNAFILLNELKHSLSPNEREELFKNFSEEKMQAFYEKNRKEIYRFLASTPKQRAAKKKWQEDYPLYVFWAFTLLFRSLNRIVNIECEFQKRAKNSYRKDLALYAMLIDTPAEERTYQIPFLFFEKEDYEIYPDLFYIDGFC